MQQKPQPGIEAEMDPKPSYIKASYHPSHKLEGKVTSCGRRCLLIAGKLNILVNKHT